MDKVQVYIKVGEDVLAIGTTLVQNLRALFSADETRDDEALAKLDAAYAARIAQAEAAAAAPAPAAAPDPGTEAGV